MVMYLSFVALLLPTLFAVVALLLAYRSTLHPILFFVLSVFTFCWLSDAAFSYINDYVIGTPQTIEALLKGRTMARFAGDAIGGAIGALIVWRLARALQKPEHHDR